MPYVRPAGRRARRDRRAARRHRPARAPPPLPPGQKLIELMVSAMELRNRFMDGAMPVEARKKPKRMATIAGPALIEPPRINTTRMIANSSTTDSEMATTDHTLGPSATPARRRLPLHTPAGTIVPPTSPPYAARESSSATSDAPAAGTARTGACEHGTPARFFKGDRQVFDSDRFSVHTSCSQVIRKLLTVPPVRTFRQSRPRVLCTF